MSLLLAVSALFILTHVQIACCAFVFVHSIPIDNSLVDAETVKECVSNKSVDLLLLLDGSGSIGDITFELQKQFAVLLARRLNVSASTSRIAVAQFAERPQLELSLTQYSMLPQVEWAIGRIQYLSGGTNTGAALQFALARGFDGARGGDVPRVAIVITDGQSQDSVAEAATRLRDADVLVYAIGVSNLVNVHELHQIAGNPVRVFTVESFEQLDKSLADSLTWEMCKTEFRPGTPDVICAPDHIGVRAATKKPFDGFVFVMDHFHQEECRAGPERFADPRSIGITVPFTDCNVHRYRSLNPRGIFVEMTVVFMFHTMFMTKVDQTVKIQCFYMEADKTVTVPMEVSMMTTEFKEVMYEMPVCEYSLRRGTVNGPVVAFATIGESIYHRWECHDKTDTNTFGMLVHSCFVDNGFGDRVDILDQHGCGIDAVLLTTPDYDNTSLRLAWKPYHVFKYADKPVLQFQCQITLCVRHGGGCEGITPPSCPQTPAHHHSHGHEHNRTRRKVIDDEEMTRTTDVFTRQLLVLEQSIDAPCQSPLSTTTSNSVLFETVALVAVTVLNVFIFSITLIVCRFRHK